MRMGIWGSEYCFLARTNKMYLQLDTFLQVMVMMMMILTKIELSWDDDHHLIMIQIITNIRMMMMMMMVTLMMITLMMMHMTKMMTMAAKIEVGPCELMRLSPTS